MTSDEPMCLVKNTETAPRYADCYHNPKWCSCSACWSALDKLSVKRAGLDDVPECLPSLPADPQPTKALTGGSSDYYKVLIDRPTSGGQPYMAECNDVIEALGMSFAEGNAFKALWRMAAARKGNGKPGTTALYDSEKVEFFGHRLVVQHTP